MRCSFKVVKMCRVKAGKCPILIFFKTEMLCKCRVFISGKRCHHYCLKDWFSLTSFLPFRTTVIFSLNTVLESSRSPSREQTVGGFPGCLEEKPHGKFPDPMCGSSLIFLNSAPIIHTPTHTHTFALNSNRGVLCPFFYWL